MKHFYKNLLAFLMLMTFIGVKGQGWPANYEGVMLQGFYWDSYSDTKWTNLEKQADELSQYFDLIWIPNSANSDNGMGYMPVFWFSNYNSRFGTEKELRSMIQTFKKKGTGFIADVVINHRNGNQSAWDFPTETWNGKTYDMADGSIVSNDNLWSNLDGWGKGVPASYKGNPDTGDLFDGCRDLDHTNATVQEHIKAYTSFLLTDLEYAGFRYDMVKGYGGQYTKIYNQYSKPTYSVGEFWDSYDPIAAWIEKTGKTSAAFDFPCKEQLKSAFSNGLHLDKLTWTNPSGEYQPAGLIHYNYRRYAVTFVDNHDTYRTDENGGVNRFPDESHVLAANAFILSSPGTPCVFLPHYQNNKSAIQAMINARKKAGITNTSNVKVLNHSATCYMALVYGTKGTLAVKIGSDMFSPDGFTDDQIQTYGNDYCIWVNGEVNYTPTEDPVIPEGDITIYYDNSYTKFNPVNCHYWTISGDESVWPGPTMKSEGNNIYSITIPAGSSVVFSANGKPQTVDVNNVTDGYIYGGLTTTDSEGKYTVDAGSPYVGGNMSVPTGDLYLNGNFDDFTGDWYPTEAKEMAKEPGHYTLRNIKLNGSAGTAYFSFADRKGEWDYVNAGTRYGADSEDLPVTVIKETTSVSPSYKVTAGNYAAWSIANGNYDIIVDPNAWTMTVYEAGKAPTFEVVEDPKEDDNNNKDENEDNGDDNQDDDSKDKDNNSGDNNGNDKDDTGNTGGSGNDNIDNGNGGSNNGNGGSNNGNGGSDNGNSGSDNGSGGSDNGNGDSNNGNDGSDDGNGGSDNGSGGSGNGNGGSDNGNGGSNNGNGGSDNGNGGPNNGNGGSDNGNGGSNNQNPTPGEDIDGIEGVVMDTPEPEFYTLQGIKVDNPGSGMYIMVTGRERKKIIIR